MEFTFTPEEQQFRDEVRSFLQRECTDEIVHALNWDPDAKICHEWQQKMAKEGLLTLGWPKQYGGQERGAIDQAIFLEEAGYRGALDDTILLATHFIVGPALLLFGTPELQQRFLPLIASGQVRFTNALTEPEAGSDLASLKTQAVQDGEFYVLNGQKTFITGADRVDYVHAATRTDPDAPSHRGISMFLVDTASAGFEARPMTNILGKPNECQIFFDNVRVPASQMLGEKNRGWYVLMGTLDILRSGISGVGASRRRLQKLCALYRERGLNGNHSARDGQIQDMLAQLHVDIETFRLMAWRVVAAQATGQIPNYEAAASSYVSKLLSRKMAVAGMAILGNDGIFRRCSNREAPLDDIAEHFLDSSHLQAGGTHEILRSVIAQRGFGLPRG